MAGAALIAKAILGSIGGGFNGAAKPYQGDMHVQAADTGASDVGKGKEEDPKAEKVPEMDKEEAKKIISNVQTVQSSEEAPTNQAFNVGNLSNIGSVLKSDATLKEIYGDALSDRLIEDFAKISAIEFKYTPEAQKEYGKESGVDDKEHTGVIAQELADTESTKSAVEPDINGTLQVNTPQLTMTNTAVIAELSRRVLTLEAAVQELMSRIKGADNGQ
jgi:ATP-dependent Lon protease